MGDVDSTLSAKRLLEPACDREKVALVYNPVSGVEDPAARRRTLESLAHSAGLTCELAETDRTLGAAPLAAKAVAHGMERLIVVGGDGSVTEAADVLVGTATALAVVPAGTGNLLALNLGIPTGTEEALQLALNGMARPIDVGRANGSVFLIAAGLGLDARIVRDADRELKRRWGTIAYFMAAWRNLWGPSARYHVTVDGHTSSRNAAMVMIANLGRITGGLELVPGSDPADGLLEVAILRSHRLPDLARLAWRALSGTSQTDDVLEVEHARHVVVECRRAQPLQIDGNVAGQTTRLEVAVEPLALLLVRPESPPEPGVPVISAVASRRARGRIRRVIGAVLAPLR